MAILPKEKQKSAELIKASAQIIQFPQKSAHRIVTAEGWRRFLDQSVAKKFKSLS